MRRRRKNNQNNIKQHYLLNKKKTTDSTDGHGRIKRQQGQRITTKIGQFSKPAELGDEKAFRHVCRNTKIELNRVVLVVFKSIIRDNPSNPW